MSMTSWIAWARRAATDRGNGALRTLWLGWLSSLLLCPVTSAWGQDAEAEPLPSYRVEILVFELPAGSSRPEDPGRPPLPPEQGPEPGSNVEQGLTGSLLPAADEDAATEGDPEAVIDAPVDDASTDPGPLAETFFFTPVEMQDLSTMAQTLRRRQGYRVLAHEAWRQPGFPRDASRVVDLETVGRLRARIEYEAALAEGATPPPPAIPEDAAVESAGESAGEAAAETLAATATLWRGRYLHLDVDIALSRGDATLRLAESRRMRSGELHYLDSPDIGAIAVIVPDAGDTDEMQEDAGATPEGST